MKLKHSLAFQLLKVTFSFYLLITVSITVIHMYTVWIQAETYLEEDLLKLGDSAQRGIVLAFWDLDYVQVDLIVEGLLELPTVVGIKVKDKQGSHKSNTANKSHAISDIVHQQVKAHIQSSPHPE